MGHAAPGGEEQLGIFEKQKRQCEWKTEAGGKVGCEEVEEVGRDQIT